MKHAKLWLCLFLSLFFVTSFAEPVGGIFLPHEQFDDVEFMITTSLLDSAGITYYVFSDRPDTCRGKSGYDIIPFTVTDSVAGLPLDFLIINGGIGSVYLSDDEKLHEIIVRADSEKKLIVASNFAPILLMKSGILKDREINFVRNNITQDLVEEYKIKFKSEPVVVSENLITSPSADFVRYYIGAFLRRYDEAFNSKSE